MSDKLQLLSTAGRWPADGERLELPALLSGVAHQQASGLLYKRATN
jgi:hypothetical protein